MTKVRREKGSRRAYSVLRSSPQRPRSLTWMPAGPRMTQNSTGRKNRIIGTVSFGGKLGALPGAQLFALQRNRLHA